MQKMIIIGNLTADPTIRDVAMSDGTTAKICNFSVAVNERYNGRETTTYFRVSAWRQLAELCHRYLSKGRMVYVEGTIKASAYTNNQGQNVASLELTAQTLKFLGSAPQNNGAAPTQQNNPATPAQPGVEPNYGVGQPADPNNGFQAVETDELPF